MDVLEQMAPGSGLGTVVKHEIDWLSNMNELLNTTNLTPMQRKEIAAERRFQSDLASVGDRFQGILLNSTPEYRNRLVAAKANALNQASPGLMSTPYNPYNPHIDYDPIDDFVPTGNAGYVQSRGLMNGSPSTLPDFTNQARDKVIEVIGSTQFGMSLKHFLKMLRKLHKSGEMTNDEVEAWYRRAYSG